MPVASRMRKRVAFVQCRYRSARSKRTTRSPTSASTAGPAVVGCGGHGAGLTLSPGEVAGSSRPLERPTQPSTS